MNNSFDNLTLKPFETSRDSLMSKLEKLLHELPDHPLKVKIAPISGEKPPRAAFVNTADKLSYAAWHSGSLNRWLIIGDTDDVIHIADLSTDEREELSLQARKFPDAKIVAIAEASAENQITSLQELRRAGRIRFLGMAIWM